MMHFRKFWRCCCLVVVLTLAIISAGGHAQAQSRTILAAGDVVALDIAGEPDFNKRYTISPQGTIALPLIGALAIEGKSVLEAQNLVREALSDGYLINPIVRLKLQSNKMFHIVGEVRSPGSYPYEPGMTIEAAIEDAGGFTYRSNKKDAHILRPQAGTAGTYMSAGIGSPFEAGDIILIKERFF